MAIEIQVTFDASDVAAQSAFWAAALDYVVQPPPEGFDTWDAFLDSINVPADKRDTMSAVVDPDGAGPRILFQKVPEAKAGKNRVHLDVNVGAGAPSPEVGQSRIDAKVADLVGRGATEKGRVEQMGESWIVMADPEGNEFCIQ